MANVIVREIDGKPAYLARYNTPAKARIRGRRDWTYAIEFAQNHQTATIAQETVDILVKAGLDVKVQP